MVIEKIGLGHNKKVKVRFQKEQLEDAVVVYKEERLPEVESTEEPKKSKKKVIKDEQETE